MAHWLRPLADALVGTVPEGTTSRPVNTPAMADPERPPASESSSDHGIPGEYEGGHPATPLFDLLGRAHTMSILFYLVREEPRPWRFSELEETLAVSPNTLSSRLEELVEEGLLERNSFDEIPPRVEYTATEKARDLEPVFQELRRWAGAYGYETGRDESGRAESES